MSLVRYHEHFRFEPREGVYFWMADGATAILCKVRGRKGSYDLERSDF